MTRSCKPLVRFRAVACALLMLALPSLAVAQDYPTRTITLLCWSEAGSPVDLFARMMGKLLTKELGQNVIVENRTGADGIIMVNQLIKAPADGYLIAANTLTLASLFGEPKRKLQAGRSADDYALADRPLRAD